MKINELFSENMRVCFVNDDRIYEIIEALYTRFKSSAYYLEYFQSIIGIAIMLKDEGSEDDFSMKVFEKQKEQENTKDDTKSFITTRELSVWCFNPGYIFKLINNSFPHTVTLTSGTLSPMIPMELELGVSFPIKSSAKSHIIDPFKQLMVNVIGKGKNNDSLRFTFNKRLDEAHKKSVLIVFLK